MVSKRVDESVILKSELRYHSHPQTLFIVSILCQSSAMASESGRGGQHVIADTPQLLVPLIAVSLVTVLLAVTVIILLKRDRQHRDRLSAWMDEGEEVKVFDAESGKMMGQLKDQLESLQEELQQTAKAHQKEIGGLIDSQNEKTHSAYQEHSSDVAEFKGKLNDVLSSVGGKLNERPHCRSRRI